MRGQRVREASGAGRLFGHSSQLRVSCGLPVLEDENSAGGRRSFAVHRRTPLLTLPPPARRSVPLPGGPLVHGPVAPGPDGCESEAGWDSAAALALLPTFHTWSRTRAPCTTPDSCHRHCGPRPSPTVGWPLPLARNRPQVAECPDMVSVRSGWRMEASAPPTPTPQFPSGQIVRWVKRKAEHERPAPPAQSPRGPVVGDTAPRHRHGRRGRGVHLAEGPVSTGAAVLTPHPELCHAAREWATPWSDTEKAQ